MSERVDRTPEVLKDEHGRFIGTFHRTGAQLPSMAWYALHRSAVGFPASTRDDAIAWLHRREEQVLKAAK